MELKLEHEDYETYTTCFIDLLVWVDCCITHMGIDQWTLWKQSRLSQLGLISKRYCAPSIPCQE